MRKSITVLLLAAATITVSNVLAQAVDEPPNLGDSLDAQVQAAALAARTEEQRAAIESEMRALRERLAVLSRGYAQSGAVPFFDAMSAANQLRLAGDRDAAGEIEATERRLEELEAEREQLKRTFTEQHPRMKLLESQIEALRARLTSLRAVQAANRLLLELDEARESGGRVASEALSSRGSPISPEEASRWIEAIPDEVLTTQTLAALQPQRASGGEREAARPTATRQLQALFGDTLRDPLRSVWDTMQLVTLTPQLGQYFGTESGILVLRAPADESLGLRDGDVILDIGGRVPTSPEHTMRILDSFVPGETLTLGIMRNGRRETREIVLPPLEPETPVRRLDRAAPAAVPQLGQPRQPARPQQRQPDLERARPGNGPVL